MIFFLAALLWAAIQFVFTIVLYVGSGILCSLFWPVVFIGGALGFLIASALSAKASVWSWFYGDGDTTQQLERSLDAAHEAARVASLAAKSQAMQAAAQAGQNSRVAEVLSQLSAERQDFAGHIWALSEQAISDSQLEVVLAASGPILISACVLVIAGLALWLVTRGEGSSYDAQLYGDVNILLDELATELPDSSHEQGQRRIGQATSYRPPRLPLTGARSTRTDQEEDHSPMPF